MKLESSPHDRPRLLFIGPYPPPHSGPEYVTKLIVESDIRNHFNLKFIKTNVRKDNVNKGRFDHMMIVGFFLFIRRLLSALIRFKPQLVYYTITATRLGWIGRDLWCILFANLFNAKIILHFHGGHFRVNYASFNTVLKKLVKYALSKATYILVLGESLKEQFIHLVDENRIKVLYNPIDTNDYSNEEIDKYDQDVILYMGHLTKAKGYCEAVRAIPLVAERFPKMKFIFAGTLRRGERGIFFDQITGKTLAYENPEDIHAKISSGVFKSNYEYCGIVTGEKKINLLKKANMFIHPSYSEGFSISLLEAMAMGKPIICTPVGAHGEVIANGVNGYLIQPGDYHELARAIIEIRTNKELRQTMAMKNYVSVRNRFNAGQISNKLFEYFCLAINEHIS